MMRWKRDRLAEIDLLLLLDSRESLTLKEICDALNPKYIHRYKNYVTYRATIRDRLSRLLESGVVTFEGTMRNRKWSLTPKGSDFLSIALLYKQIVLDKEVHVHDENGQEIY